MKKVELSSLNIGRLYRLQEIEGSEARLYKRFSKLIKIYNPDIDRVHRMKALESLSGLKIKNVIIPQAIILDDINEQKAAGCIMRYHPNAKKLSQFFIDYDRDEYYERFLSIMCASSMTLQDIHEHDLTYGDINSGNILYTPNFDHLLCDFDGVSINNMGPESSMLYMYRYSCGINKKILTDKSDKISMYLYLLRSFFQKFYELPTLYEYDKKSEQYKFLKDSRSVFLDLINAQGIYPEIPYLYEMFPFERKILKKNKKIACKQSENIIY